MVCRWEVFTLIALGYTMVYGIIKLINFAHGDIFMVGAFAGLYIAKGLDQYNLPAVVVFLIALVFSMAFSAILGMVIERIAYRPLRNASRISILITAVGVSFLLENGGIFILGPQPKGFPEIIAKKQFEILGLQIDSTRL